MSNNQLQAHAVTGTDSSGTLSTLVTQVDWHFIANLAVPGLIVVVGWFFLHWLTGRREVAAARRGARVSALEKAYMHLFACVNIELTEQSAKELEAFVAEIQLYGTPHQIDLTQKMVDDFKAAHGGGLVSFDPILKDLRDELRAELCLEKREGPVWWLRLAREHKDVPPVQPLPP